MNKIILSVASIIILVISIFIFQSKTPSIDENNLVTINTSEFQQYISTSQPVIIDVRTSEEFAEGHIEGAINMDFYNPNFTTELSALNPDQSYAIYCRSGNRSSSTLGLMRNLGFTDVSELAGGFLAWERNSLKICTEDRC